MRLQRSRGGEHNYQGGLLRGQLKKKASSKIYNNTGINIKQKHNLMTNMFLIFFLHLTDNISISISLKCLVFHSFLNNLQINVDFVTIRTAK